MATLGGDRRRRLTAGLGGVVRGVGTPPVPVSPVQTAAPAITGTKTVGQVLAITPGTYTGATGQSGNLRRGGVNISGASGTTSPFNYTVLDADLGAASQLQYVEAATNTGGSTPGVSNVYALTDPTAVPGLALWLDASDASTIVATSGAVSQWKDKSGAGNHATQATGSLQPITGTQTQNGLNALDFNGHNMQLPSTLYSGFNQGANTFYQVVARIGGANIYGLGTNGPYGIQSSGTTINGYASTAFSSSSALTASDDSLYHLYRLYRSGSSVIVSRDGTDGTTGTAVNSTIGVMTIGSYKATTGSTSYFASNLAFTQAVTSAQDAFLRAYLKAKWATP